MRFKNPTILRQNEPFRYAPTRNALAFTLAAHTARAV